MRFILILFIVSTYSCKTEPQPESKLGADASSRDLSEAFKSYWYNGQAELSSYDLEFYRYGEKRQGKAMLIFVTEDFLKDSQVKANSKSDSTVSVMKLNSTKNFNTGIYPYSIMQSAFLPLEKKTPALKVTSGIQEWCGQSYAQLNHRSNFEIQTHSYFEGEADSELEIEETLSENTIWIQLRIDPNELKTGATEIIPDFSYLQLNHKEFKSYKAEITQEEHQYIETKLIYEDLGRNLIIYQDKKPPYSIEKWEEVEINSKDTLISTAKKINSLRTQYWKQNSNKYLHLRDSLRL